MPRKQQVARREPAPIVVQYHIQAKSSEYIFCPGNAIQQDFYTRRPEVVPEFVTVDGVSHRVEFIGTWNNVNSEYDDEFDSVCQKYYGMPFEAIRSMWIGRLSKLDSFWHLVKLD